MVTVWCRSPNLAYNDDEVASYDDEEDQAQQDSDGRLNPVRAGWNAEERYKASCLIGDWNMQFLTVVII